MADDNDWGFVDTDSPTASPGKLNGLRSPPNGIEPPILIEEEGTGDSTSEVQEDAGQGKPLLKKSIASSPSFNELSNAIGLALTLNDGDSAQDLQSLGRKPTSPGKSPNNRSSPGSTPRAAPTVYRTSEDTRTASAAPSAGLQFNRVAAPVVTAHSELANFSGESDCRAIMLFHSPRLDSSLVRGACQKYGVLYYSRPEFHSKGVTLLSYFDLRAAIAAKEGLARDLGGDENEVSAHFSVMLQAANNTDESRLILRNFPAGQNETAIQSIFSPYGPLKSIQRSFSSGTPASGNDALNDEFVVEYFDTQDARRAASELGACSSELWSDETEIVFAPLDSRQQKYCKQLLAILSRWRGELSQTGNLHSNMNMVSPHGARMGAPQHHTYPYPSPYQNSMMMSTGGQMPMMVPQYAPVPYCAAPFLADGSNTGGYEHYGQQHILPVFPNVQGQPMHNVVSSASQHLGWAPNQCKGNYGITGPDRGGSSDGGVGQMMGGVGHQPRPAHHGVNTSVHSSNTKRGSRNNGPNNNQTDFALNMQAILSGSETRTTLMIRNIPNKYTQVSVLEEINVKHRGLYDFFYLPIDFKNRCNVGYAFINFIDATDVAAFFQEFSGSRWKNFNSEKICAVTFARIQGKSSMITRFQNSSLLEKDDEYRPLLFASSGHNKGKPEPFPLGSRSVARKEKDIPYGNNVL